MCSQKVLFITDFPYICIKYRRLRMLYFRTGNFQTAGCFINLTANIEKYYQTDKIIVVKLIIICVC